jgi:hypothetical protein
MERNRYAIRAEKSSTNCNKQGTAEMSKKIKPCPASVITAGALLVKCRIDAAALVDNLLRARAAVKAAAPDVMAGGALEMEMGEALDRLMEAARVEGLISGAHNSLRQVVAGRGFSQPTNEQITAAWPVDPPSPRRGGGGGRGR